MIRAAVLGLLLAILGASAACAAPTCVSAFARPVLTEEQPPTLRFAQRAIERSWGPSEDSLYTEVRVPEWRSEGGAALASAAVPGLGHLYVGERSGYLYLLAEAAGWVARTVFERSADDRREEAERFAGAPDDPASAFSAERWALATGGDAAELQALYVADRNAFLRVIASDDRYLQGWAGDASATRATFQELRDRSQDMRHRARWAEKGLWLNHVVSAVDALRAARLHNLPLRRNLELKLKGTWRGGSPGLMAVVERRF
jgi:hypothetical protein